jgi:hypothetical protein
MKNLLAVGETPGLQKDDEDVKAYESRGIDWSVGNRRFNMVGAGRSLFGNGG